MTYQVIGAEYVEIDGVPLSTPAWMLRDHAPLWGAADTRGSDILIPGATGVRANPRRPTVTRQSLELDIVGDFDWEGTPQADVRVGLARNIAYLRDNVAAQPDTPDGTRTLVVILPFGATPATRTAAVHVEQFRIAGTARNLAVAQLTLSIPAGAPT